MRGAWEVRTEREPLQNQLAALVGNAGRPGQEPAIKATIRNMTGRETAVRYEPLLQTANLLLAAAPSRFKTTADVHKMLRQLADVSRTPEAFGMVSGRRIWSYDQRFRTDHDQRNGG